MATEKGNQPGSVISGSQRMRRTGHPGMVVWLTGLSGAGKSTIAFELERQLFESGRQAYVLDGDKLRTGLCSDLGFLPGHRKENIRRAGEVARLIADAGLICIAAFISPYRSDRDQVRTIVPPGRFVEVHVSTPLEVCEQRDPKGLYARARRGLIADFTGVSAPYEEPLHAEVTVRTESNTPQECAAMILRAITEAMKNLR